MSGIVDALADLDVWLENRAPITAEKLYPPGSEDDIRQTERVFGVEIPEEVRSLYRWHNGSPYSPHDGFWFLPGWVFLSLADSISEWRRRNALFQDEGSESGSSRAWNKNWMPLGADFSSSLFVVDLGAASENRSKIFEADLENGPMVHEGWPSLSAALNDVIDVLASEHAASLRRREPVVEAGRFEWRSARMKRPRRTPQ